MSTLQKLAVASLLGAGRVRRRRRRAGLRMPLGVVPMDRIMAMGRRRRKRGRGGGIGGLLQGIAGGIGGGVHDFFGNLFGGKRRRRRRGGADPGAAPTSVLGILNKGLQDSKILSNLGRRFDFIPSFVTNAAERLGYGNPPKRRRRGGLAYSQVRRRGGRVSNLNF